VDRLPFCTVHVVDDVLRRHVLDEGVLDGGFCTNGLLGDVF
jgi:hypothetical protein